MKRRHFLKTSGAAAFCACAGSAMNGCKMISGVSDTPEAPQGSYTVGEQGVTLLLKKIPSLGSVGGSVKIEIDDEKYKPLKLMVARAGESEYQAYYNKCTHGEREMEYLHEHKTLTCVSFGHSRFDGQGKVLEGPAEKPLKLFPLTVEDDKLTISI